MYLSKLPNHLQGCIMSNEYTPIINPFEAVETHATDTYNNGPEVMDDGYTQPVNPFEVENVPSKSEILESAKNKKLGALSRLNNKVSLDDSYTDMGNGWLESNSNKLWNDMSGQEIQSLMDHAIKNYALSKNEQGNIVDKEGNIHHGYTRRLYDFGTKAQTSDEVKLGLARGDTESSRDRYIEYPSGQLGADINRLNSEVLLPNDVAVMLEAAIHGRKGALENRVIKDRYADPELTNLYGGGSSEYYTSRRGALGETAEINEGLGKALFKEYMDKLPDKYRALGDKTRDRLGSLSNPFGNTLSGFGATFVNELAVKPLDAIGDLTGLYDLDENGETIKAVESAFGYNPRAAEEAIQKIGNHWDVASNSEASTADRVKAAGNGILEAITTPEMLGTSLGALLSWITPGAVLKVVGVGSKFANTAKAIDAAVDAGTMTRTAGKIAKAKEFMSVDGAKSFLASQSGFVTSALGNVNKQYEEFVANNNYQELEGSEKAKWFAGRFAVQMVNQNLDKLVAFNIMKSPGVTQALVPAIKAMSNKEFTNVAKHMAKGLAKTSLNMGSEAAQEYAQTSMELFNSRFGSEKFEDLDTFTKFLSDPENIREGGIAALAGAGGSTQFEMLGTAGSALSGITGRTATATQELIDAKKASANPTITEKEIKAIPEEEVKAAKAAYGKLLGKVRSTVIDEGINEKNIGMLLEDLDEVNVTKHIISTSSPEQVAAGEKAYEGVVTKLEQFVLANPNLKLTKRISRKSVEESLTDKTDSDNEDVVATTPENVKSAFQTLSAAMGTGEVSDFSTSAKDIIKRFTSGDLNTVIPENSDIVPELQALELAVTGKVSENLNETFDVLKNTLKGKKFSDFAAKTDSGQETVLGSQPVPDLYEETDYDDITRSITAERVAHTILGSGRTHSQDLKDKIEAFALTNGVSKERFGEIVKGYASVEQEATVGKRGYVSRLNRLNAIITSSNPNEKEASKEYSGLLDMYTSVARSEEQLSRGIASAENKAKELNRLKVPSTGKNKQHTIEYKKYNSKSKQYDTPYKIWIKKVDGKWIADTKNAKGLLASKKKYVSDMKKGLRQVEELNKGKIKSITSTTSGVAITVKEGKYKKLRQQDAQHIVKVNEIVDSIISENAGVNKVILGEETHEKWNKKGDYYKTNALLINNDTFTDNDVVLIDSLGVGGTKKRYYPEFGEAAKASMEAAVEAGATFVLDASMNDKFGRKKNPLAAGAVSGYLMKSKKGYVQLRSGDKLLFIKETPENAKAVRERKTTLELANEVAKTKKRNKAEAVSLHRAIESKVNPEDGSELATKELSVLTAQLEKLKPIVANDSFDGNTENLEKFLNRQAKDDVVEKATEILNQAEPDVIDYEDKALQSEVEKYIAKQQQKDLLGKDILSSWDEISGGVDQNSKSKEKALTALLEKEELKPKSLIDKIFGVNSLVKGKKDLYEKVYMNVHTNEQHIKPLRKQPTEAEFKKLEGSELKIGGYKHVFVGVRRVVQDVTKLANVTKTTVVNSLPIDYMSFGMRDAVEKFTKNAKDTLAKVSEAELSEQTDDRGPKGFLEGNLYLHNSPARGLFFDKEGKVNTEVMSALYIALGNTMVTDSVKWSRGYKADVDVAKMFGVQEFELTYDMKKFAYEHGTLLKTAATSIGKDVLAQLGVSKRKDKNTSSNEYEAFMADVGNTALLIAEEQGLVKTTSEKSNTIAAFYKDGEQRDVSTDTHFIHFSDKAVKDGKFTRNKPNAKVEAFKEAYVEATEGFPETSTERVEPFFKAPDSERLDKAMNEVRNDIAGKQVPEKAKETIKHLMETPYSVDLARVDELLDAVNAEGSKIKELLGFVEIGSEKFEKLYFREKEVQEGKNRDIEKSINELVKLKEKIEKKGLQGVDMYFDYFYSGNDRYMLDSNTINPQTDKLHRFLVVPSGHKLDYNVELSKDGGVLFNVDGVKDKVDSDQSFTVRMALAQAFGAGIDKMDALDIIDFGNAVLSMSSKQISEARKAILEHGEFKLIVGGKEVDINHKTEENISDVSHEGEAEHLTHTLQGLDFLDNVQSALAGKGKMTSSLSLEFDSLTSGFANKTQQMPILDNMEEHFARTGVLTKEYQERLAQAVNFKGDGVAFDPALGQSVADLIATGKHKKENDSDVIFRDSYVSMANTTIEKLRSNEKQEANLSTTVKGFRSGAAVFDIIKPLLPGGDSIDSGDTEIKITSLIRNLFKNPFMIFNYSAGISRIVKNLGSDVAHDITKSIAKADFNDPNKAGIVAVAEDLVEKVKLLHPETKAPIKTALELQKVLRNYRLASVTLASPITVGKPAPKKKARKSKTLEDVLETTVSLTYGAVIEDVFKANFDPFIKVQDAMNDTFKVAFRIFDKKRVDILKDIQKSKPDHFLSLEDHAKVLEELWNDFPWIVGPLTGKSSKVDKKDVIAVVTSGTRAPNVIEESRKKPQTMLSGKHDNMTRTVTPLVKYLEEAVSAGSVLPFHAIDGAEISVMFAEMQIRAMAAIHDAVIPPLNESDRAGFEYNKGMAKVNSEYVLADALEELAGRIEKTINTENFSKDFDSVGTKGIKLVGDNKDMTFSTAAQTAVKELNAQVKIIKNKRAEWYGSEETGKGKLEGAWIGNLVGTPGGMYQKGMLSPDLSYKEAFKGEYKEYKVTLETHSKEAIVENVTEENVDTDFTDDPKLLQNIASKMFSGTKQAEVIEALAEDPEKVDNLIEEYEKLAAKSGASKRVKDSVAEIIKSITPYASKTEAVSDVDESTNNADSKAALNSVIENKLKDCK